MPRVKINMLIEPEFKSFLEYLKDTTGTPISRIMEIATQEKYSKEYQEYLEKTKEKE